MATISTGVAAWDRNDGNDFHGLDECKGKLSVNIELKYYGHDEQLEQRVADVVDAHGMASDGR